VHLKEALTNAIAQLSSVKVGSPRLNAETLLMFCLGCDRAYLFAHPERQLTAEETRRFHELIDERARGVPAQYITGHQEFWGLDFLVSPAVLIPRPETEHLIEAALPIAKKLRNPSLVDVGTGSGCIAIALATELTNAKLYATDISESALEVARTNAVRHQVSERIDFRQTDLLQGLESLQFDLVLSNPPYVGESEADQVQLEVRKFEPKTAVFAGSTGLEVIERLIPQAAAVLKPGGSLIMEISGTIADGVRELLRDWKQVKLRNDLQGISRVVMAQK
jgi:release factor glutamine methyltransferase